MVYVGSSPHDHPPKRVCGVITFQETDVTASLGSKYTNYRCMCIYYMCILCIYKYYIYICVYVYTLYIYIHTYICIRTTPPVDILCGTTLSPSHLHIVFKKKMSVFFNGFRSQIIKPSILMEYIYISYIYMVHRYIDNR